MNRRVVGGAGSWLAGIASNARTTAVSGRFPDGRRSGNTESRAPFVAEFALASISVFRLGIDFTEVRTVPVGVNSKPSRDFRIRSAVRLASKSRPVLLVTR